MRKLFINLGVILLLLSGTIFLCWKLQHYSTFALSSLLDKHHRLDALNRQGRRKMIIVGGSSCPYGFDSKEMEDSFHIPVEDLGLHAGFGLKFTLNDCLPYIRKGDIILLSPEYQGFLGTSCDGEAALNELIFGCYPHGIFELDRDQWGSFLSNTGVYLQNLVTRPLERAPILTRFYSEKSREELRMMAVMDCRSSFDSLGDMIIPPDFNIPLHPAQESLEGQMNAELMDFLSAFKRKVEDRGAMLVVIPQPYERQTFDASRKKIEVISQALRKAGMPFLDSCGTYAFDPGYIFNTVNHLNRKGREIRTRLVIRDLAPVIQHAVR